MTKQLETKDVFVKNPHKSILFMLMAFPDGLKPRYLLYELGKNHGDLKLFTKTKIPKYLEKNKEFDYSKYISPNCISSAQHLSNCIIILKSLGVVYKSETKIKITSKFLTEGKIILHLAFQRLQKPSSLFNISGSTSKGINKALSDGVTTGFFNVFNDQDKDLAKEYLKTTISSLEKINQLGVKYLNRNWNAELIKFYYETKSDKIKKVLSDAPNEIFQLFNEPYMRYEIFGQKEITKHDFDVSMGLWPIDDKRKNYFIPKSIFDEWIYKLKVEMKGEKYDIRRFNKTWSEVFLKRDYNLSEKEILEIVNWAWKNIDILRESSNRFYLPAECTKLAYYMLAELGEKSVYKYLKFSTKDDMTASIIGSPIKS